MKQLIFLLLVGILLIGTFAVAEEIVEKTVPTVGFSEGNIPENSTGDIPTPCGGGGSDGGGGAPG